MAPLRPLCPLRTDPDPSLRQRANCAAPLTPDIMRTIGQHGISVSIGDFSVSSPAAAMGTPVRPEPPAHPLLAKLPVPSLSVAEADESLFNPTASPTSVVDFD